MATSTSPSRQGRPKVSVMITAPHPRLARSRRAEASGSFGRTVAKCHPRRWIDRRPRWRRRSQCCVSEMMTPRSIFTMRRDCDRISSIKRASLFHSAGPRSRERRRLNFAEIHDRAFRLRNDLLRDGNDDGSDRCSVRAWRMSAARSSPGRTSGRVGERYYFDAHAARRKDETSTLM